MRGVVCSLCMVLLAGAARADWVAVLSEDFEGTALPSVGWTVLDNDATDGKEYCWDNVAYNSPPEGLQCGWCAAGGADGLDPASFLYPNYCDSWLMTTGWIDISDSVDVTVDFYHWVKSEALDDTLWVGVSTDGVTYYPAWLKTTGAYSVSGNVSTWVTEEADLSDVDGLGDVAGTATQVKIAIVFESDADLTVADGAFIDDVVVWKYVETADDDGDTIIVCGQMSDGSGPGAALVALFLIGGAAVLRRRSSREAA